MSMLGQVLRKYRPSSVWGFTGIGPRPNGDLSVSTRDALFELQFRSTTGFEVLTVESLLEAKICETKYYARDVLKRCHSIGIIDTQTGRPNTYKIDKSIVSKIAIIPLSKQRQLVNMLFFWEEELVRWDMLCTREQELSEEIASTRDASGVFSTHIQTMTMILKAVEMEKKMLPSERDDAGRPLNPGELPGYQP